MFKTELTERLGIQYPIVQAGMGGVAMADLVAAVSNAGGLGVIGAAILTPDSLREGEGGPDIVVAQGTEGGGHTGRIATLALVPQVVDAVAPVPVVAAGGIADGRGLGGGPG